MEVINQEVGDSKVDNQMSKVDSFCTTYNIDEDGKVELIKLFNECMVHVAMGIMNLPGVQDNIPVGKSKKSPKAKSAKDKVDRPKCNGQTKSGSDCRNRALENEMFCKTHLPKTPEVILEPIPDSAECNAICANGSGCKQKGRMMKPDGAEFKYCFKHSKNWKKFEGETGATGATGENKKIVLTKDQNDERVANNLSEEEYPGSVDDFINRENMAKDKFDKEGMENWVKENQIVVENTEKVELKEKEEEKEVRVKQKRPNSSRKPVSGWMKKAQESELKRQLAVKNQQNEMLSNLDEDVE